MEIFSNRTNKSYNVECTKKDQQTGSMLLTHRSFLDLYNQVQDELGLVIKPLGLPNTWMCFDRIAVPVELTDKNGHSEVVIGEVCKATLTTEIVNQYPIRIAYNRGFDAVLKQYMQLPNHVVTDTSVVDNEVDNDKGFPAEVVGMVQHQTNELAGMAVNVAQPAPIPVQAPIAPSVEAAMPVQPAIAPTASMPVAPTPAIMTPTEFYSGAEATPTNPPYTYAAQPVVSQSVVAPVSMPVVETPVSMPTPVISTSAMPVSVAETPITMPAAPVVETATPTANDWNQVITFGPLAHKEEGPMTIATAPKDELQWYIQNIVPESKFYPLRQAIEAYLAQEV